MHIEARSVLLVARSVSSSGIVKTAPVSAIIPTCNRVSDLATTLDRICECDPQPSEIIIHVDGGDNETAEWLEQQRSHVSILESSTPLGPGGGRNRLLDHAQQPYAASFDDDSYPIDSDYFERIVQRFEEVPSAGILVASVFERDDQPPDREDKYVRIASFLGGGSAYRLSAWRDVQGFVPLLLAYGMEEIDVALQMMEQGWDIVRDYRLRVFHDTDLTHHEDPEVTAAAIANRALLGFLRYPVSGWGLAAGQFLSRIWWSIRAGRTSGIMKGIFQTPKRLWKYRHERNPVSWRTLRRMRRLQS